MEKKENFVADHVKSYSFKKRTRDCSWQCHIVFMADSFQEGNIKKFSGELEKDNLEQVQWVMAMDKLWQHSQNWWNLLFHF